MLYSPAVLDVRTPLLLLVEDDPGDALIVEEMLTGLFLGEYVLRRAQTLCEGRVIASEQEPACVLLDLGLPDGRGSEVIEAIKDAAPSVPIVILTGWADEQAAMQMVQRGAQDYLVKGTVEADTLARAIRYAIERKRLEQQLTRMALHDPLTGLPNRALFLDRLQVALAKSSRTEAKIAVLFLDLDHFKEINDNLGHAAGDELLRQVSGRLTRSLREGDTAARFGGDEFTLLCEGIDCAEMAKDIALRLEAIMREAFLLDGRPVHITPSVGVAVSLSGSDRPEDLIRDADASMYQAKQSGGDRIMIFDEKMRASRQRRGHLDQSLKEGLDQGQFHLAFQPIVELPSGRPRWFEALLRWNHPTLGAISPGEFIPVAEETRAIVPLGAWVIDAACAEVHRLKERCGLDGPVVSINVSPRQLEEADVVEVVSDALARHRLEGDELILEITESTLMKLSKRALGQLEKLRSLGARLALDDFGVGYSSLSYLQDFPMDVVKVDRSFIARLGGNPEDAAFAKAIVTLSESLHFITVAEGIESQEQAAELWDIGCRWAQGFFFSKPLAGHDLERFMEKHEGRCSTLPIPATVGRAEAAD